MNAFQRGASTTMIVGVVVALGLAGWRQLDRRVGQAPRVATESVGTWVALEFVDQEGGATTEFMGRVSGAELEAILQGQRDQGYLRLEEVFWLFEDGSVVRLEDDLAHGSSTLLRVEGIRRITPLKEGFAEEAGKLKPESRFVPAPGRST